MPRSQSNRNTAPSITPSIPASRPSPQTSLIPPVTPTLGQTLKEGLAFGTGSAIAHRIFNPYPTQQYPTQQVASSNKKIESPCEKERLAFEMCTKTKSYDDFCGPEQAGYIQCIQLSNKE
jgi:hypothetical protein